MTAPPRRPPRPGHYVGTSVPRVEDASLLAGAGNFVDDITLEGQLWARVVRSDLAHGRILRIGTSRVEARGEVAAVVTGADMPDVRIPIRMMPTAEAERVLQPPLARDVVRYVGEPVAVVVATDPYVAEDAAEDVELDIVPLEPVVDVDVATGSEAPQLHADGPERNYINTLVARNGEDADALLRAADVVVRDRLIVARQTAVPLETRGLVADYDTDSGRVTVWGAAKVKHFNLRALAGMLGIAEDRIRFVEVDVGGGFGVRGEFYPEDFLVPWLAMRLQRPVKWIEDRAEHMVATNHARDQVCDIEMGASADGRLLGFKAICRINQGAYAKAHGGALLSHIVLTHIAGPYRWEGFHVESSSILTNKTPSGTYRGPSQYESTFFRERLVDRVAAELGLDPAELRRRNLVPPSLLPYEVALGAGRAIVYDAGDFPATWERLLDRVDFASTRARVEERRGRGELVGVGLSAYVEAGGIGPVENARVEATDDGRFVVHVGVASLGQGVRTALTQIAADALDVPIERVEISHHDTDLIPEGMGAFGSRTTLLGGNAVAGAVEDLHSRAKAAAAARMEIAEEDLEIVEGRVMPRGSPGLGVAIFETGEHGECRYEKETPTVSMGCSMAIVSVDRDTCDLRVERYALAHDVGRMINPAIVEGQLVGAAAQGIAGAVLEAIVHGPDGQPLTTSLMDYMLPTAAELPTIETAVLELASEGGSPENPLGAKGCAESGIIGAGAAVANAVADALGQGVDHLPITPTALHQLLAAGPRSRSRDHDAPG